MLETPLLNVLERAMDYSSMRQSALSDNIANINTPGYQRKDISFDQVLATAGSTNSSAALETSDPRHFSSAATTSGDKPAVITHQGGAMRMDGNNVDIDSEMSKLAQNQIYYQALAQLTASQFTNLKSVIKGSA